MTTSPTMRAKLEVKSVEPGVECEHLQFEAVCKPDGYPADGSDEDNTFALFTPTASLSMSISNPALFGKLKEGEKYYLDFIKAEPAPAEPAPAETQGQD